MQTCHEEASRGRLDVAINLEANSCGMGTQRYGNTAAMVHDPQGYKNFVSRDRRPSFFTLGAPSRLRHARGILPVVRLCKHLDSRCPLQLHLHVHELPQKSWSGTNTTCYNPIVVLFNGGDGVPLAALDKLKDGQLPALPASSGMRQKASFRLNFDMNRKRNRQYNVHRLLNNGTTWESITKAEMASIIAREMKQLMVSGTVVQ